LNVDITKPVELDKEEVWRMNEGSMRNRRLIAVTLLFAYWFAFAAGGTFHPYLIATFNKVVV